MIHELKIWPQYFEFVQSGAKTFEVRANDRNFNIGDTLQLREWHLEKKEYTGRRCFREITYILSGVELGDFSSSKDFVVMSIKKLPHSYTGKYRVFDQLDCVVVIEGYSIDKEFSGILAKEGKPGCVLQVMSNYGLWETIEAMPIGVE